MAFSYKASISFGLVYIPVKLHAAVKPNEIGFNMLDKDTKSRIKYKKTCVDCDGKEVKQENIVKGYEYEDGKYVIFTEEDFEIIKSDKDKNITIERFVELKEIDPVYFDRAYYVEPTGGEKAFLLLLRAMEEGGKAGIAKTVLGTKETLVVLRAREGKLIINTLFFYDEIVKPPFNVPNSELNPQELTLAKSLLEGMGGRFAAEEFKDEYGEKLKAAIAAKIAGKEIEAPEEQKTYNILSLMDALQQSVKNLRNKGAEDVAENKSSTGGAKKTSEKAGKKPAKPEERINA
ncbi:Ku protein [bacterium]|nr:Ku protein [bacterium]